MAELRIVDPAERDDLGAFVARAVRLDAEAPIRLQAGGGRVDVWVGTPFDALATRSVPGEMDPGDVTVHGPDLLAALAVVGGPAVDPGVPRDLAWRGALPTGQRWQEVDTVPASVLADLADTGVSLARDNAGPHGPPAALLDQKVITVSGAGFAVPIPLRCLFALSGMGFVGGHTDDETVRVSATDSWLRLDARYGAVLRRRHSLLPLLAL